MYPIYNSKTPSIPATAGMSGSLAIKLGGSFPDCVVFLGFEDLLKFIGFGG